MFGYIKKLWKKIQKRFYKGHLESNSDSFHKLIPRNTKIKNIAAGFRFTEGPVWIDDGDYLLFSDIPANRIYKLNSKGKVTVFREPSGNSNGLTLDKKGRLIACEHGNRRVTRTENDGSLTILADSFNGKKLNSPNDVVVKSDGNIYFTDPPFGIKKDQQELPHQGVYKISPETNEITLVTKEFNKPNGLAFSPDEKKIFVDDSELKNIKVFDVENDGSLSNGKTFYNMNIPKPGNPDGMKLDIEGNIYCTGPGGIWIFTPEGKHLGKIVLPEIPSNCAWGDKDNKSLYITAQTSVYKIRTCITGYKPY